METKEVLERIMDRIEGFIDPEKLAFKGTYDSGLNLALKIVKEEYNKLENGGVEMHKYAVLLTNDLHTIKVEAANHDDAIEKAKKLFDGIVEEEYIDAWIDE